ncbi:MAG: MerR family transcriptional regulator [Chloroflexales bacterium]|nr:MerR family transcriptional regulator [Chloroflexales bacterium]
MPTSLRIGEIARLLGITPKTIRHYHKLGLIVEPPRSEGGYRLYTAGDLFRLHRIKQLQALGLSLKQIRSVLGEPDHEHSLIQILTMLLDEIATRIAVLEEQRAQISKILQEDELNLDASPTLDLLKQQLGEQLEGMSPEFWEQERKLYAILEHFNWAPAWQQRFLTQNQRLLQYIAAHPQQYLYLLAWGERLTALAGLREEAPEIKQLAIEFVNDAAIQAFLTALKDHAKPGVEPEGEIGNLLGEMLADVLAPAQQRFFTIVEILLKPASEE